MLAKTLLTFDLIKTIFSLLIQRLVDSIQSLTHYYTYKPSLTPKDIVVIGASYAGYFCAEHLSKTLPSGWRVVVIEKNAHFNHTWLFPRASAIKRPKQNVAELAYIPYTETPAWAPTGSFLFRRGKVVGTDGKQKCVILEDGEVVKFEYLILATGLPGRYPTGIDHMQREQGLEFFRVLQTQVKDAQSLIIIGGGPVGIEVALDIESEYPEKVITLIHSRDKLAHKYGTKLHDACMKALTEAGVKIILNERVRCSAPASKSVKLSTGEILEADAVIMCTGATPASTPLSGLPADTISSSGMIRVNSHLQVDDPNTSHIFAVGDIADTSAKKMGRAAGLQGLVTAKNIVRKISGQKMIAYKPGVIEGGIIMTLGLRKHLLHMESDGACLQFLHSTKDETMRAEDMWKMLGARPQHLREEEARHKI